jgi:hypothetical protein
MQFCILFFSRCLRVFRDSVYPVHVDEQRMTKDEQYNKSQEFGSLGQRTNNNLIFYRVRMKMEIRICGWYLVRK